MIKHIWDRTMAVLTLIWLVSLYSFYIKILVSLHSLYLKTYETNPTSSFYTVYCQIYGDYKTW